jgi:hypothetical protein
VPPPPRDWIFERMLLKAVCGIDAGELSYPLYLRMMRRVERIRAIKIGKADPGPQTYPDE